MWIIMPLIYFMSWKSCRRFGQAFSETAAWALGYMLTTGILLALHYGGVGMISATPDDPLAIVALLGGFAGMAFSRYLWKRRGGHLEPINNPLTNNRWFRAARVVLSPAKKKKTTARPSTTVKRSTSASPPTSQSTATRPPAAHTTGTATRPAATRSSSAPGKSTANRWGRALGAMLQPNDSQRRPPSR